MKSGICFSVWIILVFGVVPNALAQTKTFHGSIMGENTSTIEMQLTRNGNALSGVYRYDTVGKPLSLKGNIDGAGKFKLEESDSTVKVTGQFEGTYKTDQFSEGGDVLDGNWNAGTGKDPLDFYLVEEIIQIPKDWSITTKVLSDKKIELSIAYPQWVGGAASLQKLNARIAALSNKMAKEYRSFKSSPEQSGQLGCNYRIVFANESFISIFQDCDSFMGGAHPNVEHYSYNFDVRSGREIKLSELFSNPQSYRSALSNSSAEQIAARLKVEDLSGNGSGNEDYSVPAEQLNEVVAWGMTPKGLIITYDLPHVIEALARVYLPYEKISKILKPNGPVSLVKSSTK